MRYDGVGEWTTAPEYRRIPARHWLPLTHPSRLSAWIGEFVRAHGP